MNSSIVSIKLSDYAAQVYYSVESTYKSLFENIYLYAAVSKFCYVLLNEAFKSEDSLNLMQPEDILKEYLHGKKTNYPIPTPSELWCVMMNELIKTIQTRMVELQVNIGGFLISIPDGTDYSLYSLIEKACTFITKNYGIKCILTYNSVSASAAYLKCLINGIGNESKDIFSVKATCFIDFGFNSTECYVFLLTNLNAICLAKGRCKGGLNDTYQLIRKKLTNDTELIPFDKWKSIEKTDCKLIKESFSCFCNPKVNDVHFTNFKQDDVLIYREELKNDFDNLCKDISSMVKDTIEKAQGISENLKTISVGSREFTLSNLKIDNFYINSEIKNQFLIEELERQSLTFNDTNYGSTLFAIGCSLSTSFYQRKFGVNKKGFEASDDINDLFTIQEMIYPSRFILRKTNNESADMKFPDQYCSSEDMIQIGQLEQGDYKLFDCEYKDKSNNMKELGIFNISSNGCYYASLGNSIGIKPPEILYDALSNNVMENIPVEEKELETKDYVCQCVPKHFNGNDGLEISCCREIIQPQIVVFDNLLNDEINRFIHLKMSSDEYFKRGNKILTEALRYCKESKIEREEMSRNVYLIRLTSNGDIDKLNKAWDELKSLLFKKKE
ncbi:hypothetical protein EHI8A_237020 [Entamoeba histolytica HM-1:IMSS-B]|uniref:Uncharacterized protein n=4 Tax=Entamoeba histolytica TaxID=5759 RepID=C4LSP6_ENTH1|nr:hypothetical protein EHI_152070 [Entamoeba histolytica HM-1:IMSS]EAL51952.2 hypothetical protein EHI_152070 [Entamoeba histolytica HM-1:IMSS]EMH77638.1 hypothetical protein EHI8A_237020 [Entamoeba histolytica HM-1:IMSS-B]ENY60224.1 hypothetical protein EHI7A_198540 [Entamoeba histolytica HM-1:IMSS-A]GAT91457.1 hypothetical protein CL6EHI_152070 [Entamoeba histolytica]|eukprot:XP_657352.2 hypothetical protein EHI_152070 [Entamoeba histolytica HM-1:IMSS]